MLPKYLIDALKENCPDCPLPCADVVPNSKNLANEAHKVIIALRAEFPELTKVDFFLFSDEDGEYFGLDGICQHINVLSHPVIGVKKSIFDSDAEKGYGKFLLLHECSHVIQPLDDVGADGSLAHGTLFHHILDTFLKLYNKRYDDHVVDYDPLRADQKGVVHLRH